MELLLVPFLKIHCNYLITINSKTSVTAEVVIIAIIAITVTSRDATEENKFKGKDQEHHFRCHVYSED